MKSANMTVLFIVMVATIQAFALDASQINLDQFLGAYQAQSAPKKPKDFTYAYFMRDDIVMSDQSVISHYFLLRSRDPMNSREEALADVVATYNVTDFYVDKNGKFFQYYSFGSYKRPEDLRDIDQHGVQPGYECNWQPVTRVSKSGLVMDYCGDSAPRAELSIISDGKVHFVMKDREELGIIGWTKTVSDQVYRKR